MADTDVPITFGAAGGGTGGGTVSYNSSNLDAQIAAAEQDLIALRNQWAQAARDASSAASPLDKALASGPAVDLAAKVTAAESRLAALKQQKTKQDEVQAAGGAQMGPDQWGNFYAQNAFGKNDIQMPGFNTVNQDQARNEQAKVIQALQAQAAGSMNTLGQQQLAQGFQQAGQQQRSLGSSIRGTGGGAGLRAGAMGAADVQRGLAGEQQMLRLQEQQAAQAMLAQLMAQQHAQDVGLAGAMAQGDLQGQGLNQQMEQFYGSGLTQNILSNYQRESDLARAKLGFDLGARDLADRQRNQLAQMGGAAVGTGIQAFGKGGNTSTRPSYRQVDGQDSIVPIDDK